MQDSSKRRAMDLLRARGAVKAELNYNGGNDEGGVDGITLHLKLSNGEIEEIDFPTQWRAGTEADKELAGLLELPVDEKYGSWAGDFSAYGVLTWNVEEDTVVMQDNVQDDYRYEESRW